VTALEALREVARTAGGQAQHLLLCDGCTYALMEDLDNLFAPATRDGTYRLGDSNVYGCTFSEGTPDTCALHAFLHDDARCTEGI
jgi:hypothetical protein